MFRADRAKARNRAAGIPPNNRPRASAPFTPPSTPRPTVTVTPKGPAFATPLLTARDQRLVVVAALTDLVALRRAEKTLGDDGIKAFDQFKKLLVMGLATCSTPEAQTEADSALRMAAITLVKLSF